MSWHTMRIPQATDEHFSSPVHPSASGCGFPILDQTKHRSYNWSWLWRLRVVDANSFQPNPAVGLQLFDGSCWRLSRFLNPGWSCHRWMDMNATGLGSGQLISHPVPCSFWLQARPGLARPSFAAQPRLEAPPWRMNFPRPTGLPVTWVPWFLSLDWVFSISATRPPTSEGSYFTWTPLIPIAPMKPFASTAAFGRASWSHLAWSVPFSAPCLLGHWQTTSGAAPRSWPTISSSSWGPWVLRYRQASNGWWCRDVWWASV